MADLKNLLNTNNPIASTEKPRITPYNQAGSVISNALSNEYTPIPYSAKDVHNAEFGRNIGSALGSGLGTGVSSAINKKLQAIEENKQIEQMKPVLGQIFSPEEMKGIIPLMKNYPKAADKIIIERLQQHQLKTQDEAYGKALREQAEMQAMQQTFKEPSVSEAPKEILAGGEGLKSEETTTTKEMPVEKVSNRMKELKTERDIALNDIDKEKQEAIARKRSGMIKTTGELDKVLSGIQEKKNKVRIDYENLIQKELKEDRTEIRENRILQEKDFIKSREEGSKLLKAAEDKGESYKDLEDNLKIMNIYEKSGELNSKETLSFLQYLTDKTGFNFNSLKSGVTGAYEGLQKDFLKQAKTIFGPRVTQYEVQKLLEAIPHLMTTATGRRLISSNLQRMYKMGQERAKLYRQVYKEYDKKHKPFWDIDSEVNSRFEKIHDKEWDNYLEALGIKPEFNVPEGAKAGSVVKYNGKAYILDENLKPLSQEEYREKTEGV